MLVYNINLLNSSPRVSRNQHSPCSFGWRTLVSKDNLFMFAVVVWIVEGDSLCQVQTSQKYYFGFYSEFFHSFIVHPSFHPSIQLANDRFGILACCKIAKLNLRLLLTKFGSRIREMNIQTTVVFVGIVSIDLSLLVFVVLSLKLIRAALGVLEVFPGP